MEKYILIIFTLKLHFIRIFGICCPPEIIYLIILSSQKPRFFRKNSLLPCVTTHTGATVKLIEKLKEQIFDFHIEFNQNDGL